MATIVPAILEKDIDTFLDTTHKILSVQGVERIHVDFCDGIFVPNTTLPVSDIDPLNPAFVWEAHLMVQESVDFLDFQIAGFTTLLLHYEAFANTATIPEALRSIRGLGMKAGLVINPTTPIEVFKTFSEYTDQYLLMSVTPGFQGSPFIDAVFERLRALRKLLPHGILEVDGGVTETNIQALVDAGADLLVAGSAIFASDSTQENFDRLTQAIRYE